MKTKKISDGSIFFSQCNGRTVENNEVPKKSELIINPSEAEDGSTRNVGIFTYVNLKPSLIIKMCITNF